MPSFKQAALIVAMALSLALAATLLPVVDDWRQVLNRASYRGNVPKQPELVLLTNVLGGFRGLLVDMVWMRAAKLQQAGKYWELYQLYDWIGKLEPHLEDVWVFNGWNMSYNLVAEHPVSEARWQWIERAIRWLRDEGLRYNPRSGKIMKEISWIYFHKIGRNLDPHNFYYKHRLALIMHSLLGPREMQDIPGIVAAPKEFSVLLADADVAKALSGFQLSPPETDIEAIAEAQALHHIPPPVRKVLLQPDNAEAWRKVRCYIARRVLTDTYKFDDTRDDEDTIVIMEKLEEQFGKFDWRLPEPHAMFWAHRAMLTMDRVAEENFFKARIDYDRLALFSLQEVMRRGVITYLTGKPEEPMVTSFDLSKVEPTNEMYHTLLAEYDATQDIYGAESMINGHVQFLQEATYDLYFSGYEREALKYYRELNERYDKPLPRKTLENFCLGRVKEQVDTAGTEAKVRVLIDGCINQALIFFCTNKMDEARKWETVGREAWNAFKNYEELKESGIIRQGGFLPEWEDILRGRIDSILRGKDFAFPRNLIPVLAAKLGVTSIKELESADFGEGVVPEIEASSPPPE